MQMNNICDNLKQGRGEHAINLKGQYNMQLNRVYALITILRGLQREIHTVFKNSRA